MRHVISALVISHAVTLAVGYVVLVWKFCSQLVHIDPSRWLCMLPSPLCSASVKSLVLDPVALPDLVARILTPHSPNIFSLHLHSICIGSRMMTSTVVPSRERA